MALFAGRQTPPRLMRIEVMLMVVTKVKTGQQREPVRIIIAARIMLIWEGVFMPVGQEGAEVK